MDPNRFNASLKQRKGSLDAHSLARTATGPRISHDSNDSHYPLTHGLAPSVRSVPSLNRGYNEYPPEGSYAYRAPFPAQSYEQSYEKEYPPQGSYNNAPSAHYEQNNVMYGQAAQGPYTSNPPPVAHDQQYDDIISEYGSSVAQYPDPGAINAPPAGYNSNGRYNSGHSGTGSRSQDGSLGRGGGGSHGRGGDRYHSGTSSRNERH